MSTIQERDRLEARLAELNDELEEIDDRRAQIKGQIEHAQAIQLEDGTYADPDWYRRAVGACRHLGVERSQVQREIGETGRALRRVRDALNRDTFHAAVHDVVDEATWRRILDRHREMTEAQS